MIVLHRETVCSTAATEFGIRILIQTGSVETEFTTVKSFNTLLSISHKQARSKFYVGCAEDSFWTGNNSNEKFKTEQRGSRDFKFIHARQNVRHFSGASNKIQASHFICRTSSTPRKYAVHPRKILESLSILAPFRVYSSLSAPCTV